MTDKIRLRTDAQLDRRLEDLKLFVETIGPHGVDWRLACGALLGAIRDQDFIRWDWDVEVYCRTEQVRPKTQLLVAALRHAGFNVKPKTAVGAWELLCRRPGGDRIGLHGFDLLEDGNGGHHRRRIRFNHPADLWDGPPSTVTLRGVEFRTFGDPQRFLTWTYGDDWPTPIRTEDKTVYLTEQFRGRRYG